MPVPQELMSRGTGILPVLLRTPGANRPRRFRFRAARGNMTAPTGGPPMPLRDHFKTPLKDECEWTSFHTNWAVKMCDRLNPFLRTRGYRALSELRLGPQVVADVGTLEREQGTRLFDPHGVNGSAAAGGGGVAVAAEPLVYAPPAPVLSAEADFADLDAVEVKVYKGGGAWNLVAAVELVSPANKDRPEARRAFAVKCGGYLQKGVSVVVVDAVAEYRSQPHADLCDLLKLPSALTWSSPSGLAAVVYRPAKALAGDAERTRLEAWPYPLGIGEPLPTVPLWLAADLAVKLDLEATYAAALNSLALD
jgi:hypothetical protein